MLVEVEVQSLGLDRSTRSPVVVLRERGGERVLAIWIGAVEASAIAMHLAGATFPRPLTHDLVVDIIEATSATLQRVEIPEVVEGTYHAVLVLRRGSDTVRVDARPSDSIAVALRAGAAIVAADDLLSAVAFEVDEGESIAPEAPPQADRVPAPLTPEELAEYLRKLDPEDFGRFTP